MRLLIDTARLDVEEAVVLDVIDRPAGSRLYELLFEVVLGGHIARAKSLVRDPMGVGV